MRILFTFIILSLFSQSCSRFTNHHDDLILDCGDDFEGREPVRILERDGSRLRGEELEAFAFLPEGRYDLKLSSKGCLNRSESKVLIRHKRRPLGFVGQLSSSTVTLQAPAEPRLEATCSQRNRVRAELHLEDFLNLKEAAEPQAYELTLSLASESVVQPFEKSLPLNGTSLPLIPLPNALPEGTHQLTFTLYDLVRQETDPLTCALVIDRTAPLPQLELEAAAQHVKGPQLLTEVDDRRALQLSTNEGQIFYCVQKVDEPLCEPLLPFQKAVSLAAWQGEVLVRYRAVDAAGNESPVFSENLLIANSFQESEVRSLASSSRSASGKSVHMMLDAIRAEEKRQALPSSIQRDRHKLSTYWAMLKNYLAPQAPLLSVPLSKAGLVGADNDISADAQWACYGHRYGGEVEAAYLFRIRDQQTITLPVPGTSCRFSPSGKQLLVVHSGVETLAHLVDRASLAVQKLPPVPLDTVLRFHIDAESRVYLASRNELLTLSPEKPDIWERLYVSEQEFSAHFGERHVVLLLPESLSIFELGSFQKKAELLDERFRPESESSISPDGRMLMVVDADKGPEIPVWIWDENQATYRRTQEFTPHQQRPALAVVINDRNEEILVEHSGGTASLWRYSAGRFVLLNKEMGVRGDIIVNNVATHKPRSRFLKDGRVGIISSHFLSLIQTQAEGKVLTTGIRRFVADRLGRKILAEDNAGHIKLFAFDGISLSSPKLLFKVPEEERYSKLSLNASGQIAGALIQSKIKLWTLDGPKVQILDHPLQNMRADAMALADDGRGIALGEGGIDEPYVSVWYDGKLQRTRRDFCLPQDSIFPRMPLRLKFLPQGDRLMISCVYGATQIWNWKQDTLVDIGADISIGSAVFHQNGRALIFDNNSVINDQTFALHVWRESEGIQSYPLNASSIEALAGSHDFQLVASISDRDLIFWNPELNDSISVWDEMIEPDFKSWEGALAIASPNLRTFVLNGRHELVYWPLAEADIYRNLCAQLEPQIYALGLQGNICK